MSSLPKGTYAEWSTPGETEERCPICLDDVSPSLSLMFDHRADRPCSSPQYQASDPCLRIPGCSHWFHEGCLQVRPPRPFQSTSLPNTCRRNGSKAHAPVPSAVGVSPGHAAPRPRPRPARMVLVPAPLALRATVLVALLPPGPGTTSTLTQTTLMILIRNFFLGRPPPASAHLVRGARRAQGRTILHGDTIEGAREPLVTVRRHFAPLRIECSSPIPS